MPDIEKMRQWLQSWPGWDKEAKLYVNYVDTVPGNCALFPGGVEEVNRKSDLLGNTRVHCRYSFTLYRVMDRKEDAIEEEIWLQALQQWVQQQSAEGKAPILGDEPGTESMRAEKGRLAKTRQPGNAMFAVEFTAEFIKNYEVI